MTIWKLYVMGYHLFYLDSNLSLISLSSYEVLIAGSWIFLMRRIFDLPHAPHLGSSSWAILWISLMSWLNNNWVNLYQHCLYQMSTLFVSTVDLCWLTWVLFYKSCMPVSVELFSYAYFCVNSGATKLQHYALLKGNLEARSEIELRLVPKVVTIHYAWHNTRIYMPH